MYPSVALKYLFLTSTVVAGFNVCCGERS
jgi:hypothetical protein